MILNEKISRVVVTCVCMQTNSAITHTFKLTIVFSLAQFMFHYVPAPEGFFDILFFCGVNVIFSLNANR